MTITLNCQGFVFDAVLLKIGAEYMVFCALVAEDKITVRGDSWYDRPKRSTSSFRLAYRQYQKVFNVGFRVICEKNDSKAIVKAR